ncbi:Antitoxin [Candidatus Roizmanbacteria bacterium]|nr:Antitoxin [Candidatus Roizmanbacteria bacterium]
MNTISISQLKINPSKAILGALDFPLAVENRNKVEAYLLGKDLYEKIVSFMEDSIDRKTVLETNFKKGNDFEKIAKELNI